MRRAAAWLALLTLVRLLAAASTPLSPDEAYYWTWSNALAPGYLDHPPMVALAIRLGTALAGDDLLGVRLLAPIGALLGSFLLAGAARDLLGLDEAGRIAAIALLNATLLVGAGAVTMTPDTPLLFFWTACLFLLGRALSTGSDRWLVGAGLATGLAFDSKYTAILLVPVIALSLASVRGPRATLANPFVWAGALAALAATAPVLLWNARHGLASFIKQGGRAGDIRPAHALRDLLELAGGQIGLATPWVALLLVAGTAAVARRARRGEPGPLLLTWATLLPAAVFVAHALGDRVQANWPSILYPGAALAAGTLAPHRFGGWRPAAASGLCLTALVYLQAALHPLPLPAGIDVAFARFGGWPDLARQAGRAARDHHLRLATDDYAIAAELAWNRAAPTILGTDRRWSFVDLPRTTLDRPVLLLRSARRHAPPDPRRWSSAAPVGAITRGRDGLVAERYVLDEARASASLQAAIIPSRTRLNPR